MKLKVDHDTLFLDGKPVARLLNMRAYDALRDYLDELVDEEDNVCEWCDDGKATVCHGCATHKEDE